MRERGLKKISTVFLLSSPFLFLNIVGKFCVFLLSSPCSFSFLSLPTTQSEDHIGKWYWRGFILTAGTLLIILALSNMFGRKKILFETE